MTKHEDKEDGKTLKREAPRSINHKATQNKNNTGTTALERSVAIKYFELSTNFTLGPDVFLDTKIH